MKLILRNTDRKVYAGLVTQFRNEPDVSVEHGDIFGFKEETIDAIISPAQSFGFMDGGIDFFYSNYFGWDLQERLQKLIREEYEGELYIGQAVVVPTNHKKIPNLISAPTMRVPEPVANTVNAYLAFRAALRQAVKWGFNEVLSPGMATGVGQMPPELAAYQMHKAWIEVKNNGESTIGPEYKTIEDAAVANLELKGFKIEKFQANFDGVLD